MQKSYITKKIKTAGNESKSIWRILKEVTVKKIYVICHVADTVSKYK